MQEARCYTFSLPALSNQQAIGREQANPRRPDSTDPRDGKIIGGPSYACVRMGFPFDVLDLRMTVKRILDQEGRAVSRFKENVPGEDWAYGFMKRHKDKIKNRLC